MRAPRVTRPVIPPGYGVSAEMKGTLRWISVRRVLEGALRYWIATSSADDGPHLIQQWGGWVDDTLYFGGSEKTRWARHLRAHSRAAISIERTGYSIMVEGHAELMEKVTPELSEALIATFTKKYRHKTTAEDWSRGGLWAIHADKVFAWKFASMGTTATRFLFDPAGATTKRSTNGEPSTAHVS